MNSQKRDSSSVWDLHTEFDSTNTARIQAAFDAQHPRYLIYRGKQGKRILYHFTRMVAAHPDELKLHTKRIYLSIACYDCEALEGAFVDFLLVLGNNGLTLRKRLLAQASSVLKPEVKKIIQDVIESGDLDQLKQLSTKYSVLINGRFQPLSLH
ncbi:MAG: hypothetical protein K6L74_14030 [Neptuniibacter sp.]